MSNRISYDHGSLRIAGKNKLGVWTGFGDLLIEISQFINTGFNTSSKGISLSATQDSPRDNFGVFNTNSRIWLAERVRFSQLIILITILG